MGDECISTIKYPGLIVFFEVLNWAFTKASAHPIENKAPLKQLEANARVERPGRSEALVSHSWETNPFKTQSLANLSQEKNKLGLSRRPSYPRLSQEFLLFSVLNHHCKYLF